MKSEVYLAKSVPQIVEQYLLEHCDVRKWEGQAPITNEQLLEELKGAHGLITSGSSIDEQLLAHAPQLRVVSNISVGYDNFDLEVMRARGVLGTNTPGVLNDSVADLVFALMLAAARRFPEMERIVKEGRWVKGDDRPYFGRDVHHQTLGIIGMGGIGQTVARRARLGFDMEVLYHNRTRKPECEEALGVSYCERNELLERSDYVVILLPLNASTVNYMDAEQLSLMKPTSILIHVSRGRVVNEQALEQALRSGTIAAAALDVFEVEPVPKEHPLLQLPNVVAVPHIGSATAQTRQDMAMLAARNMVAALSGQTPPNLVNELRSGS